MHEDGLLCCASRPCKRHTCLECAHLPCQVTHEENMVRVVMPSELYLEPFDGYVELMEDDFSLLCSPSASVPNKGETTISPQML